MRGRVIGAGRLLLPNPEVARANGWQHGLPIEGRLHIDLSSVNPLGLVGEVGRFCIEEPWRGGTALVELSVAMCVESLQRGVTHWLSAANMECDSEGDARIIYRLLERRGLVQRDIRVTPKGDERPRAPPRFFFYTTEEERGRALECDPRARLPRAIGADAALGARYIGEPLWDPYFGMFAMPLIAVVEDVLQRAQALGRRRARYLL
jgi:hypothetical protein